MSDTHTTSTDPHAPAPAASKQGSFIVGVAALEGGIFATIVYLSASFTVWSNWFYPSEGNGERIAINSTVVSLLFILVLARIHRSLQKAVSKYGAKMTGWSFALDLATSCAPTGALVIAGLVDLEYRPLNGYYWWAIWYLIFISVVVLDSAYEEYLAFRRYKS